MSILPFRHSSPAGCEEHTVLCDSVLHSNQPPSQLWTPISRDISHPFPFPAAHNLSPIGRSSLPLYMQGSSAGSVAGPTSTTDLGAEQARFGYVSPPASTTHNYSGIAGTGYPLNPAHRPHPHHPVPSPVRPPSSIPMLPCRRPSVTFDAGYCGNDPPSMQHDYKLSPPLPTRLSLPYPSPEPPYHAHHRPPVQAQSTGLYMHRLCQTSAVPATQTFTAFLSRPPVFDSTHSSSSASYNEADVYRVPSFEPDSIHWNSPPTSSGLPVTPPDHAVAPQLPSSSQLQPPKSPQPHYVPTSMLPFSAPCTGPAFPTGNEKRFTDTQASLKSTSSVSLNEGTKDVFQSLKRKRLPVAAAFSRPKPRTLPVKKVLPKIHGCTTCGKMFDRPSTLLVHQASHTKAKDYACNKCRKTFSVNSNMRRHWRNCAETPRDYSIPSSPSVPIKQEVLYSPSTPSDVGFADEPLMPGPSGPLVPALFTPRSLSEVPGQQTLLQSGVSPTMPPLEMSLPKMAVQPESLRLRFVELSTPEVATPVAPVQPRMTEAQEAEMKGWFLREIWRVIVERLKGWRTCTFFGASIPAASRPAANLPPGGTTNLNVGKEGGASTKKRWGEERDSWLNKGYAPYWGAQWIGVLPGPGPDDPPAVLMDTESNEETAGAVRY